MDYQGAKMRKGLLTHQYEVHLPIAVRAPGHALAAGVTDFMSSRDVRFRLEKPHTITRGTTVTLFVSLPPEFTTENQVLIRARGRVLNVEHTSRQGAPCSAFTAAMESYDFVGPDVLRDQTLPDL
jgi:hypothetical protein